MSNVVHIEDWIEQFAVDFLNHDWDDGDFLKLEMALLEFLEEEPVDVQSAFATQLRALVADFQGDAPGLKDALIDRRWDVFPPDGHDTATMLMEIAEIVDQAANGIRTEFILVDFQDWIERFAIMYLHPEEFLSFEHALLEFLDELRADVQSAFATQLRALVADFQGDEAELKAELLDRGWRFFAEDGDTASMLMEIAEIADQAAKGMRMETITADLVLPLDIVRHIKKISAEADFEPSTRELMEACIIEKFRDRSKLEDDEEVP